MNKTSLALTLLVASLVTPLAQAQFLPGAQPVNPAAGQAQMIDRTIAIVDDNVILQSDLTDAIQSVEDQAAASKSKLPPHDVVAQQVLNRLIMMSLQVQHAHDQGLRVSDADVGSAIDNIAAGNHMTVDQLRQAITSKGGSFAAFRRHVADQILVQKLRDQVVQKRVRVTDSEVNNLLTNPSFQVSQVHLARIVVGVPDGASASQIAKAEAKAEEAERALHKGTPFATVAMQYSSAPDALQGGDLGWRPSASLSVNVAKLVSGMQPGDVSKPLRDASGFNIIKLIDRKQGGGNIVKEYRARLILIKPDANTDGAQARADADKAYRDVTQEHEDFAKVAKDMSDDGPTANKGGQLGWVQPGDLKPAIANVLQNLHVGEVSKPFQTSQGWAIVKLENTRKSDTGGQNRRAQARMAIGNRKAQRVYADFLRELRANAYIDVLVPALREPASAAQGQS